MKSMTRSNIIIIIRGNIWIDDLTFVRRYPGIRRFERALGDLGEGKIIQREMASVICTADHGEGRAVVETSLCSDLHLTLIPQISLT